MSHRLTGSVQPMSQALHDASQHVSRSALRAGRLAASEPVPLKTNRVRRVGGDVPLHFCTRNTYTDDAKLGPASLDCVIFYGQAYPIN